MDLHPMTSALTLSHRGTWPKVEGLPASTPTTSTTMAGLLADPPWPETCGMPTPGSTLLQWPLTSDPVTQGVYLLGLGSDRPKSWALWQSWGRCRRQMLHCQALARYPRPTHSCAVTDLHPAMSPRLPRHKGSWHKGTRLKAHLLTYGPLLRPGFKYCANLARSEMQHSLWSARWLRKFSLIHKACSINHRMHTWNVETNGTAKLSSAISALVLDTHKSGYNFSSLIKVKCIYTEGSDEWFMETHPHLDCLLGIVCLFFSALQGDRTQHTHRLQWSCVDSRPEKCFHKRPRQAPAYVFWWLKCILNALP